MNTKNKIIIFIIFLFIVGGASLLYVNYFRALMVNQEVNTNLAITPTSKPIVFDPLNTTYFIDNVPVTLVNGQNINDMFSTAVFGKPKFGDLNGDGLDDAVLILTQETGGSGNFFYVVTAIKTNSGAKGTNSILLGDRVAPQNIGIESGQIVVNYADRKPTEPMATPPSIGVSMYLVLDGSILKKLFTPTQSITYLTSLSDPTKYCNGVDMDSAGYQKTIVTEKTTITPELNTSVLQLIKATIKAATTGSCREALNQANITENNGVIVISSVEGWAGISIAMCSCKPQVEVNLLRIPGITQILW